ncbi:MAG: hypothetical protein K6U12_13845 [Armatimonadetes bacterium]|nr:hypothetical protein [Armatimonadota bacterium]
MKLSYRTWMTLLLGVLILMIPLGMVLMRLLPEEGVAQKKLWLRWAAGYLLALFGVLSALIWVVLKEVRQTLEQFRQAHRQAFEEMTEQIREDYRKRQQQQRSRQNGAER